jgi:hypothetical protein
MLSVAIAQNGIFCRRFAAATYGGSGFGGGGATDAAGAVGAGAGFGAGDDDVVAGALAAGASAGAASPVAFAFAAWLRLRRCSGISVISAHADER